MRATFTIAWRDFKTLVTSPIFCVVAFFCSALWSYVFLRSVDRFAQMSAMPPQMTQGRTFNIHFELFTSHLSLVNLICIVAIPALTMRLLSEEKKQGTYDLLLTSPITATNIALGKFLGGFAVSATILLIGLIYPFGLRFFTEFNMGPLLSSALGVLLMIGVYTAVGLFASSLTQSQVLSVILGIVFNFLLWFVNFSPGSVDNQILAAIFEYAQFPQQVSSFLKGTINTSAIVFLLSCISFFVFLTQRVVESSRWR